MSQLISLIVAAIALYSAFAEDLKIVVCFLAFQEIEESPKKMQKPVIDFLESGQVAQSKSEKALRWKLDGEGNRRP